LGDPAYRPLIIASMADPPAPVATRRGLQRRPELVVAVIAAVLFGLLLLALAAR